MGIAQRYVSRELIILFSFILAFLLIVVVGGRFLSYLEEASLGALASSTAVFLIFYRLPEFFQIVLPFALYFAVLLTFGRLYAESEMAVFQSSGVDTVKILRWISLPIIIITFLVAILTIFLTPLSTYFLGKFLVEERANTFSKTTNLGSFLVSKSGSRAVYTKGVAEDGTTLENVFVFEEGQGGKNVSLWAKTGIRTMADLDGSQYLELRDGIRYEGRPGFADYSVLEFETFKQRIELGELNLDKFLIPSASFFDLDHTARARAEFHWRLALPIFCLVGSLLALGLSKVKPRQGRFVKIVPGAVVVFFYYLLLLLNHNAIAEDSLPSSLGLWLVHGFFLGVALWLVYRLGMPSRT